MQTETSGDNRDRILAGERKPVGVPPVPPQQAVEIEADALSTVARAPAISPSIVLRTDLVVMLDPQGAYGAPENVAAIINKGNRSDLGGQITLELGLAMGAATNTMLDVHPQLTIVSQIAKPSGIHSSIFGDRFAAGEEWINPSEEQRKLGVQPVRVLRFPLSKSDEISQYSNLDKLEVQPGPNGRNLFYKHLEEWSRMAAASAVEENQVPQFLRAGHGIGAYCLQFYLDELRHNGVDTSRITIIGQVHASGESSAAQRIEARFDSFKSEHSGAECSGRNAREVIEKVAGDINTAFAVRMVAERVWHNATTIVSSKQEYESFARRGWHTWDIAGLPRIDPNKVHVRKPGISDAFYLRSETQIGKRLPAVEQYVEPMRSRLPSILTQFADPDKPTLVLRGRWLEFDDRKGFLAAVRLMALNEELRDRINLLILAGRSGDPLSDLVGFPNQKLNPKTGQQEDTLMSSVRQVIKSHNLQGRVHIEPIIDQFEQAALHQVMGEINFSENRIRFLGGSFAQEEPHGLVPPETLACGVPITATVGTGAASHYRENGAIEVFDLADGPGVVRAVNRTIDGGVPFLRRQLKLNATDRWSNRSSDYLGSYVEAFNAQVAALEQGRTLPNTGVIIDFNQTEQLQRLVNAAVAYFVTERYHKEVFVDSYVRQLLSLRGGEQVTDQDRHRAVSKVLLEYGLAYDATQKEFYFVRNAPTS